MRRADPGVAPAPVAGFTLLEVLIAMLVLAIALLGLAKLQAFGMRNTGNAYYRTQATLAMNQAIEQTRAATLEYPYHREDSITALPGGRLRVDCPAADSLCSVAVDWDESSDAARGASSQRRHRRLRLGFAR